MQVKHRFISVSELVSKGCGPCKANAKANKEAAWKMEAKIVAARSSEGMLHNGHLYDETPLYLLNRKHWNT